MVANARSQIIELYQSLLGYGGPDASADVLEPWLLKNIKENSVQQWIGDFYQRTNNYCAVNHWVAATEEDLWHLYALSRVTSLLLLRFQSGRADGTDYPGPAISIEGFQRFHRQLGFTLTEADDFHPFFHEIVTVVPAQNTESPAHLTDCIWPCLMLGDMQFCRAGVVVTAGAAYMEKGIAEASKLYWTHRRKNRPYHDLSHGWGHNSQWNTAFRRDYRTSKQYYFNVDGRLSLNDSVCAVEDITLSAMTELVRHRCMVQTDVGERELFPYDYSYVERVT